MRLFALLLGNALGIAIMAWGMFAAPSPWWAFFGLSGYEQVHSWVMSIAGLAYLVAVNWHLRTAR